MMRSGSGEEAKQKNNGRLTRSHRARNPALPTIDRLEALSARGCFLHARPSGRSLVFLLPAVREPGAAARILARFYLSPPAASRDPNSSGSVLQLLPRL